MKDTSTNMPISHGRDNLFIYRKEKPFDRLEDSEFMVRRLSPETDALSEKAVQAEVNKEKIPWPVHLLSAVLLSLLLPIQWLIKTLLPEAHHNLWGRIIYYGILFIFFIMIAVVDRKFKPSEKQRAIMLAASNTAVREELGIPEASREIDVLPYVYKETPTGPVPACKDGRFENVPVCIWRDGDDLCLSDEDALIKIPVKAIGEMREVACKVHISAWYKAHAFDSPNYKPYVKQSFWAGIDVLSYFEVEIKGEDSIRYLLIPNYEPPTFRELADPTRSF